VLIEVANEERQHVGEFLELLRRLAPDEQEYLDVGRAEVEQIAAALASPEAPVEAGASEAPEAASGAPGLTIGGLRGARG